MRNDSENHKYTNWRVNYLFANYLFGKNFSIMANIELMFVSLIAICQTANDPVRQRNEREDAHRLKMLSLFSSIIDVYDVMFRGFSRGLNQYVMNQKKLNADTVKNYLRMAKIGTFFEQSGKKTLISTGTKRREEMNFKFFKILLARSQEFSSFVDLVYKKEVEEHLEVVEFQCIAILHQLQAEAEDRKNKKNEPEPSPKLVAESEDGDSEPTTGMPQRKLSAVESRARADSEAIMFEEDEDERLGNPVLQKRTSAVDKKTKDYLAIVRQFQYEDEYDDTHDIGDGRRNQRGRGRGGQARGGNQRNRRNRSDDSEPEEDEVEKGSGFPVEQENEDSGEDVDPMNKWERTQSNMTANDGEDGPMQRNPFRGGRGYGRGGADRTRGGNKIDGKRDKYNQNKYGGNRPDDNNRDHQSGGYHQKRDEEYRTRGQGQRDEEYRPRGNDRDNYKPRGSDYRDDNRNEYRERGGGDRGKQGYPGKPKQGNRDTR
jgi:hypothetical protein